MHRPFLRRPLQELLLDEAAVLARAAYVDLNPVRAAIAETPEESDSATTHSVGQGAICKE